MKRGGGGFRKLIKDGIWYILFFGIMLGVLQITGFTDLSKLKNDLLSGAAYLVECVPAQNCDFSKDIDLDDTGYDLEELGDIQLTPEDMGYVGPDGGEPYVLESSMITKQGALALLNEIVVAEPAEIEYSRSEWKHWNTYERSCWTVRKEVLAQQSVTTELSFLDSKQIQTDWENACVIQTGSWIDPYSGEIFTESGDLDIDHVIPLSYAARHGGQEWSAEEKQAFANDFRFLLATSAKENRAKGDKGPSEYLPPNDDYLCAYSKSFTVAASTYNLSVTKDDKDTLISTIQKHCQH